MDGGGPLGVNRISRQTFMTTSVLGANQLDQLNLCLIISGQSLEHIMQDTTLL